MKDKTYRLQISNYYEWKNFREKGITIAFSCGKKKAFIHGTGHTPIREIVQKITELLNEC